MLYVWYMATVHQIGFLKETCLDHSTPWGSSLSIYPPNFVIISWSGAEVWYSFDKCHFWGLSVYGPTKFQENSSMRFWVICNSTFSIPTYIANGTVSSFRPSIVKLLQLLRLDIAGIPCRVSHVPQLLPWSAVWGGSRLHVPTAAVSHSLPHTEPSVWLRLWLDNIETESCKFGRRLRQPANRHYCWQVPSFQQ